MIKIFNFFQSPKKNAQELASIEGEKYFNEGYEYAQFREHEKAIELFTKSISVNGKNACVYINRGASYAFQERYLLANRDYETALGMELLEPSSAAIENVTAIRANMSNIKDFIEFERLNGEEIKIRFQRDEVEPFCKAWSDILQNKFLNNNAALVEYFVLEELNELSMLGDDCLKFAIKSGFSADKYRIVTNNDATYEAFKLFKSVLCCFSDNQSLMLDLRFNILDTLMKNNALGKYAIANSDQKTKTIMNLNGRDIGAEISLDRLEKIKLSIDKKLISLEQGRVCLDIYLNADFLDDAPQLTYVMFSPTVQNEVMAKCSFTLTGERNGKPVWKTEWAVSEKYRGNGFGVSIVTKAIAEFRNGLQGKVNYEVYILASVSQYNFASNKIAKKLFGSFESSIDPLSGAVINTYVTKI